MFQVVPVESSCSQLESEQAAPLSKDFSWESFRVCDQHHCLLYILFCVSITSRSRAISLACCLCISAPCEFLQTSLMMFSGLFSNSFQIIPVIIIALLAATELWAGFFRWWLYDSSPKLKQIIWDLTIITHCFRIFFLYTHFCFCQQWILFFCAVIEMIWRLFSSK